MAKLNHYSIVVSSYHETPHLLCGLCNNNRIRSIVSLFNRLQSCGRSPNLFTYSVFMDELLWMGFVKIKGSRMHWNCIKCWSILESNHMLKLSTSSLMACAKMEKSKLQARFLMACIAMVWCRILYHIQYHHHGPSKQGL